MIATCPPPAEKDRLFFVSLMLVDTQSNGSFYLPQLTNLGGESKPSFKTLRRMKAVSIKWNAWAKAYSFHTHDTHDSHQPSGGH